MHKLVVIFKNILSAKCLRYTQIYYIIALIAHFDHLEWNIERIVGTAFRTENKKKTLIYHTT